jgi:lipopolysaccharide export system permease protein
MLSRSSELVVLRAAGVSVWQFTLPAMAVAFVLGVVFVLVYNPVAAMARAEAERIYSAAFGRGESFLKANKGAGAWLREDGVDGPSVVHALQVLNQGLELNGVTAFQYTPDHTLTERIEAKRAVLKNGRWELQEAWVSSVGQEPAFYERYLLSTYLTQPRYGVLDLVLGFTELHPDSRTCGTSRNPVPRAVPPPLVATIPASHHGAHRGNVFA